MDLRAELSRILDADRVLTRYLDRIAWANDASVYRLVPRAVVRPVSIEEIRGLFRFSRAHRIPLTFRAAGTSLSGQAVTDGVLVDVARHWRAIEVLDAGRRVRVQPGAIGGGVNRHLLPYGAKIGPDPASISACMMGGILANNSSGMCCGVVQNAYHTLESISFVLPDGTVVDSSKTGANDRLTREAPALARGLLDLKAQVEGDSTLRDRIRSKYRMKNTNGYSLNAFIDFSTPVDILAHLMIGSEGTLGFIAEAVLNTVPDYPVKYTGLLFFPDVTSACAAIATLRDSGARALELMDRASLRSIEDQPGVPPAIRDLSQEAAALLVEYQCASESELEGRRSASAKVLPSLPLCDEPVFTRDPDEQAALWRVRKGLIPSVGAMRRAGTSFIIEDVVFPVERLAEGVTELQALFRAYGYDDAITFGHAKDGNLHFVLTQAFQSRPDVERYDGFMKDLAVLVADRHGGALKAEHGTGRNMAPFVETEWGGDAYEIMKAVKRLADPDGLLNPGIIINDDPRAHLADLKALPAVEDEVDPCIECGFCERVCPSRDLTLSPRQRIVVRREMARLRDTEPESPMLGELETQYDHAGLDSCAADGMCATTCPVGIDTGALVKRLRAEARSDTAHEIAVAMAERFGLVERGARAALRAAHLARGILGDEGVATLTRMIRGVFSGVPPWAPDVPRSATGVLPQPQDSDARAVYFPSCTSRVLGASRRHPDPCLMGVVVEVCRRAGLPVRVPGDAHGHCCGMPFSSKGYGRAYVYAVSRTVGALWRWSEEGRLPVILDSSPCVRTLRAAGPDLDGPIRDRLERLEILDGIEFAHDRLLSRFSVRRGSDAVALHPVCSAVKMNLEDKLERVAAAFAGEAIVPVEAGCCGFAGDRGFLLPELTAAATRAQAAEVGRRSFAGYYSSSRTCEIALARATGRPYRSFWYLLEESTR